MTRRTPRRRQDAERNMSAWLKDKSEDEFLADIRKLAAPLGWTMYHTHRSDRSDLGFPDLVLVKPPRVIFAELKRETESPSPVQLFWYGLLLQCPGVEAYVWKPRDMDEIIDVLQGRVEILHERR